MESRDVTLRDYFRVFAEGKWALIIGALAVALVAFVISLTRPVTHTAESVVYMGISTNIQGQTISTPYTTPVTAMRALRGDSLLADTAERSGLDLDRVKDGTYANVDRVPGASGGNQPTVAILTFTDRDEDAAVAGVNAYAEAALAVVQGPHTELHTAYQTQARNAQARIRQVQANIARLSGQGGSDASTALVALQSQLSDNLASANTAQVALATLGQYAPSIVSRAESAPASATMRSHVITGIFGAFIGLILGGIVALIWKGSPAESRR